MDRQDSVTSSGSASYYMERAMPGLQEQLGFHPISNPSMLFQSNVGSGSAGQAVAIEPESINVNVPSLQPSTAPMKRRRGRPRKYGPERAVSLALSTSLTPLQGIATPTQRRGRGRPPGTGRKQQLAVSGDWMSGSAGADFTPHVILIAAGEDIASKIMSFAQQGMRSVCIMSANGAVCTATLCQPSTSGGTVTYEGRYDILCMSGSFLLIDNNGSRSRTGGLSISLASPDGRVIGGGVGGMLIAASPVQVILGSFIWGDSKSRQQKKGSGVGGEAEHGSASIAMAPTHSVQQSQTPPCSMDVWASPQAVDMQNSHFDIDLMHG